MTKSITNDIFIIQRNYDLQRSSFNKGHLSEIETHVPTDKRNVNKIHKRLNGRVKPELSNQTREAQKIGCLRQVAAYYRCLSELRFRSNSGLTVSSKKKLSKKIHTLLQMELSAVTMTENNLLLQFSNTSSM